MKYKVLWITLFAIALSNSTEAMELIFKKVKEKSKNKKLTSQESDDKQRSRSFDGILTKTTKKPLLKRVLSDPKIKTVSAQKTQELIDKLIIINKKKNGIDRQTLVKHLLTELHTTPTDSIDWNYEHNGKTVATILKFNENDKDLQALQIQINHLRPNDVDNGDLVYFFNKEKGDCEKLTREQAQQKMILETKLSQEKEKIQAQQRRYLCASQFLTNKEYRKDMLSKLTAKHQRLVEGKKQTNIQREKLAFDAEIKQVELEIETYTNLEQYILQKSYDTFTKYSSDDVKELLHNYFRTNQPPLTEIKNPTEAEKKQLEFYQKWNSFFSKESKQDTRASIKTTV
jgi:hypothetical protein